MNRPNLLRVRSLPSQQLRGFAVANASELSSDDDAFSDSSDHDKVSQPGDGASSGVDDEEGGEGDQYPVAAILKLPSIFSAPNRLLVNVHDEAERQAKQQQDYEAVMKRFQVRRVAMRAFSTSNVTSHARSPQTPGHSLTISGRREVDAAVQQGELKRGAQDASTLQRSRRLSQTLAADDAAPRPRTSAISRTSSHSAGRHSIPSISGRRVKTKGFAHSYPPESQRSTRFTLHRFVVKKRRRLMRRLKRFVANLGSVIYPTSTFQRVREGVLLNLFVVQLILLPLLPVYFASEAALITGLQFVAEWVYFVDCALSFNTAFFRKTTNELVTNRREIAMSYLGGWFAMDLLSSIPVNTLVCLASGGHGLFELSPLAYLLVNTVARVPRFVIFFRTLQALQAAARTLRAGQNFWTWALLYSRYSHLLRITRLIFTVILLEHFMTCVWQYLASENSAEDASGTSSLELYLRNYYLVVLLIHGQSVDTVSVAQTLYSITAIFLGSFVIAIVFGNVAMLVSNFNSSATNYQRNMEKVFATMKKMQLPAELQDRIHQFFTHLWQEYDAVDADLVKFPKELTPTLALEVGLCQYMNLITGVAYWRECSPDFVSHVIRNLVVRVYLPDDFVLRQREISHDLFMINRGTCELTHPLEEAEDELQQRSTQYASRRMSAVSAARSSSHKKHAKFYHSVREVDASSPLSPELLHPGEVFGGMGLLLNFEQQFNVRAVTHVEMCVLGRAEFQKILLRFQHDRPTVLTALLEDVILKNELPFSMEDVFGVFVADDEQSTYEVAEEGDKLPEDSSRPQQAKASESKPPKLTPSEAAHFLMKKINHEGVDPSIKFGFQQVNLPPSPSASQEPAVHGEEPGAQSSAAGSPGELPMGNQIATGEASSSDQSDLQLGSSTELTSHPETEARRHNSSPQRQSSTPEVGAGPEQLTRLQDELQHLATRFEGFEGSQVSVLSSLEALQQSVARISLNVAIALASSSSGRQPSSKAYLSDAGTLHRERSIRKILSLPSNWEQGGQAPRQKDGVPGEQRRVGFARSGVRLRVSRAMSRSHSGLTSKEFVPAQPETSRTRSYVHPAPRRASMFPRRSPVLTTRPSLAKKRELLADSLWTQYPSPTK